MMILVEILTLCLCDHGDCVTVPTHAYTIHHCFHHMDYSGPCNWWYLLLLLLLLFSPYHAYRAPFPQVCSGRLTNHMLQRMIK